jgi:hypothetical protein
MTQVGEGVTTIAQPQDEKTERKCPKCGANWTKTEPNLAQVRGAVRESFAAHRDDLQRLEKGAMLGYRGSVARGTVGNPDKLHYLLEPDIRGECGIGYDVDGFALMGKLYHRIRPDKFGKRWAARYRDTRVLETKIRASLNARSELQYMKKGAEGFELLIRHYREEAKLFEKGGAVIIVS